MRQYGNTPELSTYIFRNLGIVKRQIIIHVVVVHYVFNMTLRGKLGFPIKNV